MGSILYEIYKGDLEKNELDNQLSSKHAGVSTHQSEAPDLVWGRLLFLAWVWRRSQRRSYHSFWHLGSGNDKIALIRCKIVLIRCKLAQIRFKIAQIRCS